MEVERAPRRPFVGCRLRVTKGALASLALPPERPCASYFRAKFDMADGSKTRLATGTQLQAWARDARRSFIFLALLHDAAAHTHTVEALGFAWRDEADGGATRRLVLDTAISLFDPRQIEAVSTGANDDELELALRAWCDANARTELALCIALPNFDLPAEKDAHAELMLAVARILATRYARPTERGALLAMITPAKNRVVLSTKETAETTPPAQKKRVHAAEPALDDEPQKRSKASLWVDGREFASTEALVDYMRVAHELALMRAASQATEQLCRVRCEAQYYRGLLEGNGWEFEPARNTQ